MWIVKQALTESQHERHALKEYSPPHLSCSFSHTIDTNNEVDFDRGGEGRGQGAAIH